MTTLKTASRSGSSESVSATCVRGPTEIERAQLGGGFLFPAGLYGVAAAGAAECIAERDLRPFAELIRQGVPSVMTAHVVYSTVDDRPASFSPVWIGEWLRGRLGFSGCVISDDLTMAGAAAVGSPSDRVRLATEAGCDLLPMCNSRANVEQALTAMPAAEPSGARQRVRALRRRERVVAPEQLEAARRRLETISWT